MRKWIVKAAVVLLALGTAGSLQAQDNEDRPQMRAKVIVHEESGAEIHRPEGWVLGQKSNGVAAAFRAAGDSEAQIEVRVSPHVQEEQRSYFFTSFHANLQKAGFVKHEVRKEASYGGKKGLETEYRTSSNNQRFRLIVWQHHHGESAYMVVGFFPQEARDQYYGDFQAVIENMKLQ